MYRAHTVSIAVAVSPESAHAYTCDPRNLPAWAPGFIKSIDKRGDAWIAQSTLLQRPDQSDAEYQADLETIRGDLATLRDALEGKYEVTAVRLRET